MSEEVSYESPMDQEVYCFTAKLDNQYHTLIISYLIPMMVTNHHLLRSDMGEQTFMGFTDRPMYLIPYDDKQARRWSTNIVTWDLHPSGKELPEGSIKCIDVPMVFHPGVEPYFHYKIEGDKLYKHENSTWQMVPISP